MWVRPRRPRGVAAPDSLGWTPRAGREGPARRRSVAQCARAPTPERNAGRDPRPPVDRPRPSRYGASHRSRSRSTGGVGQPEEALELLGKLEGVEGGGLGGARRVGCGGWRRPVPARPAWPGCRCRAWPSCLAWPACRAGRLPAPPPAIPGMPGHPRHRRRPCPSDAIIFRASTKRSTSRLTSLTSVPDPRAIRARRDPLRIFGSCRSAGVIDWMIAATRSISRSSMLSICVAHLAHAREHPEQLGQRAHLADGLHLLEEVLEGEVVAGSATLRGHAPRPARRRTPSRPARSA